MIFPTLVVPHAAQMGQHILGDALDVLHGLLMRQRTERRAGQMSVASRSSLLRVTQGNREGTQECSISAVRVYDDKGQLTESVETGSPLAVEVDLHRGDHILDMACTVGIFNESHAKCWEVAIPSLITLDGALQSKHTLRLDLT